MKIFIASALFALVSVSSTVTAIAADDHSKPAKPKATAAYQSSMYVVANTTKMAIAVDKEAGAAIYIKIMDEKGNVLTSQQLDKKDTNFRGRFDMSELKDGKYQVVITNGTDETKKEITLSTKPVLAPGRVVDLQ
ncbi:hypothetical protein GCM10023189_51140 [Nibrella saemangeumensis]|uniref:Por secretion system C-terminal sorting domain-containing protein n=1 Tax=Nibrella saemangeumensis TaxID=1084526 RepID=A0ABP8NLB3_9BACT